MTPRHPHLRNAVGDLARPSVLAVLTGLAVVAPAGSARAATPPAASEGTPHAVAANAPPDTPSAPQVDALPAPGADQGRPPSAPTVPDPSRAHLDTLTWTALLEPAVSAEVCALVSAPVLQVRVQEGDRVTRGDTLILLDSADLRLAASRARLAHQTRQSHLDRAARLHAQGGISTQELEALRYEADVAQLRCQQADLDLGRTVFRAPITGCVAACAAQVGQLPAVGHVMVVLVDPVDLKADLFLPAPQLARIRPRQHVQAVPAPGATAGPGRPIAGRVTWVSPLLDARSGQGRVRVLFAQAGRHHRPGTLVRVQFTEP